MFYSDGFANFSIQKSFTPKIIATTSVFMALIYVPTYYEKLTLSFKISETENSESDSDVEEDKNAKTVHQMDSVKTSKTGDGPSSEPTITGTISALSWRQPPSRPGRVAKIQQVPTPDDTGKCIKYLSIIYNYTN